MQEAATTKHHDCRCHKNLPTSMVPTKQLDSIFLHRFYRAKSLWSLTLAKHKMGAIYTEAGNLLIDGNEGKEIHVLLTR
jgi:hypothetical protein